MVFFRRLNPATRLGVSVVVAAVVLVGCAGGDDPADAPSTSSSSSASDGGVSGAPAVAQSVDQLPGWAQELLASHGLDGLDATEIVSVLDETPVAERPTDLIASVRPDALMIIDAAGQEAPLALPEDLFYVSFAPYLTQTHECHFHSLTTCKGELSGVPVSVSITDDSTGSLLVDGEQVTYDNGFTGVWLPKGIDATVTVTYDGKQGSVPISTRNSDDATCVTTLHLT